MTLEIILKLENPNKLAAAVLYLYLLGKFTICKSLLEMFLKMRANLLKLLYGDPSVSSIMPATLL